MTVTLRSSIRQRQQSGAKSLDGLEVGALTATGATYAEAKEVLERKLPDGWILLGIMRLDEG
ncbi:hypothetical protein [Nocardioides phosphati]|uniref:hypothetical protein n=1 Tax=Nocardioides phosphati TaxID=1867775 RepID=UPI0016669D4E|nr:hypothetical protein [Nocardioides phosphati]